MINEHIDGGRSFDWGRASADYARYRDIYPQEFYDRVKALGICDKGARVLDIGTGTGVLPRALFGTGARFTGADISAEQISQARELAAQCGMDINFVCSPAEELPFSENSFDAAMACQCFWYFDHEKLSRKLHTLLKVGGRFAVLVMDWLPFEDEVAAATERLVLKYNPQWSGGGEVRHMIDVPECWLRLFGKESEELFDLDVPFTRDSWNGRIKACRGIGASLSRELTEQFSREHKAMLESMVPESFTVKHYAAITVLKARA